jgi:serine/threonine-protein kinase
MRLSAGQVLTGRYRLDRRIAIGGMGEVWQADDTRLGRQVAVKVLKPELSGDAEFRHRFHAEARITASLNHPGIAAVHDYGETASDLDPSHPGAYLVMELIAGDSLATILQRHRRLPTERTLDILEQAGTALQAAHERGLVHRDIKPANILITPAGTVKLTDFGIARAVDAAPTTRSGMVMGTAQYLAPEQAAGDEAGPACDVYALAVVGYECLAGQRPFWADNAVSLAMMHIRDQPPSLPSDVPCGARALIEAALVKDPRQRYRTGGEFAAAAAAIRGGQQLPPLPQRHGLAPTARLPHSPRAQVPLTQVAPTQGAFVQETLCRLGRRGAGRIAIALLGAFTLALGGYLVRDVLGSPGTPSGGASGAGNADVISAPVPPAVPPLFQAQPAPEPNNRDDTLPEVLIIPTDYWGHWGSDAVVAAKVRGLIPRVVDDDGEQVDPDLRSQCRIIGVNPRAGYVPRGSTLELTCRRGK